MQYNFDKEKRHQQPVLPGIEGKSKYDVQNERFNVLIANAQLLFSVKNKEYENTIEQTGVLGAAVEIIGISGRLKALVLHRDISDATEHYIKECEKDIQNAFMDAAVYGIIGLMMLQTGNWDGER